MTGRLNGSGAGGAVAAGHPEVVRAALAVLADGGNAFDAAVTAGFVAAVAEPGLSSLAGGGFLLARTAEGSEVLVDFFVDTPGRGGSGSAGGSGGRVPHFEEVIVSFEAADQSFHCGPASVAVPGCLPGYLHVHREFGSMPLERLVAPAATLAREGVRVSPVQGRIFGLLAAILGRTAEGRAIFFPGGELLGEGDTLCNPELAAFFDEIGSGRVTGFVDGVADALLATLGPDGAVTRADLEHYRVVQRPPTEVGFCGRRVLTNSPPAFGGPLLAATLSRLDDFEPGAGNPARLGALVDCLRWADSHRTSLLAPDPGASCTRGTTHVSVADRWGNVASMTTSNGECSGDVVTGTGILCNNMLGEDDLHPGGFVPGPAGQRVGSNMSPTLVCGPGGVELVIGSGGSKRIRSAIAGVVSGTLQGGLDLVAAVRAPRVHWDVDHIEAEPGLNSGELRALREVAEVRVWPEPSMYFGGTHGVQPPHRRRSSGVAVGDPRRDGAAGTL